MTPPTPPPVDLGRILARDLLALVHARLDGRRWSVADTDRAESLCRRIGAHDVGARRQEKEQR